MYSSSLNCSWLAALCRLPGPTRAPPPCPIRLRPGHLRRGKCRCRDGLCVARTVRRTLSLPSSRQGTGSVLHGRRKTNPLGGRDPKPGHWHSGRGGWQRLEAAGGGGGSRGLPVCERRRPREAPPPDGAAAAAGDGWVLRNARGEGGGTGFTESVSFGGPKFNVVDIV